MGGGSHPTFGFNKGEAPKDRKAAIGRFKKEYSKYIPKNLNEEISFQVADWKFNADRSPTDLLLYTGGFLGEGTEGRKKANASASYDDLYNEHKAEIEEMAKSPEFKDKLMNAKMELYLSPKMKEKYPDPEVLKEGLRTVWGKRIGYTPEEIDSWIESNFDNIYNESY